MESAKMTVGSGLLLFLAVFHVAAMNAQAPAGTAPRPASPGQGPARDAAGVVQTGTAKIRGRVVAADTGTPLRRAQVRISSAELREGRIAATDEQGRYELKDLPAGRYTLSASKSGFLGLSYGQRRPLEAARPLELADAAVLERVDFSLPKGSVIVAHIADEFGEPVAGALVQVQQYRFSNGQRRLTSTGTLGPFSETNDRGELRLYGLAPGDYYVMASLRSTMALGIGDAAMSYAPTYYPGTTSVSDAQRITVNVGQEMDVSFSLAVARAAKLSGVVRSSDGSLLRQPSIQLTQVVGSGISGRGIGLQPDSSFSIPNLLPGDYTIVVSPAFNVPDAPQEFASLPIKISGEDVIGLVITTSRGAAIRGRFVFDTNTAPTGVSPGRIQLTATQSEMTMGGTPRSKWNDDWTFEMTGLTGKRLLRVSESSGPATGWFLKAVIVDDKDVTDTALDFDRLAEIKDVQVILTQKRTDLSGAVVDARNAPVSEYVAILFPAEHDQRTFQSRSFGTGRPDQQGRFKITGLPPGQYLATAVEYLAPGDERDPELLERLESAAQRVTLGEGESKTVSLKIGVH